MSDPAPSGRSRSTIIYIVISAGTIAVGLAVTLGGAAASDGLTAGGAFVAIGTSVLAGGLTSAALGVLRYLDDKDQESQRAKLDAVAAGLLGVQETLRNVAAVTSSEFARSVRVENSAQLRTISDLDVGRRFRAEYQRALNSKIGRLDERPPVIEVDVAGLKLQRFLADQLTWMVSQNRETKVRLLLQNPGGDVFREICRLEGRSEESTREDCRRTLLMLSNYTENDGSLVWRSGRVEVQLRFYADYQPVTLFRVGEFACVRPRISTPLGAATRFYEEYDGRDGNVQFQVQAAHFSTCWGASRFVAPAVSDGTP